MAQASVGPNALADVPPAITGLVPDNGPESVGTVVTITGTSFTGATGVTFDGTPGTVFSVDSDTQITVTSPAHVPGVVDVVVDHPDGDSAPADFTYTPLVSVTDIDPNFGPTDGGTVVTITGTCFTGVTFDGVPGTLFSVDSDTQITVTSPAHVEGAVDVVVRGSVVCGGDETVPDGFTYVGEDAPVITGLVPDNVPESGGTVVTITGTGFTDATGATFDGLAGAVFSVDSDTQITVTSPAHAPGLVGVIVQHPDGNSGPEDFTYTPLIAVTDIDPGTGPEAGGTVVTITGTCFTGATGVLFDGIAGTGFVVAATSFVVVDDENITALTPPHPVGPVDVVVQHPDGASAPMTFTYLPAASIEEVEPGEGPEAGGTVVTITGTCFTGATGVLFGDTHATSFIVVDDTTIVAIAPKGVGTVDVTVLGTEECGDGTLDDGYRYIPPALSLTGLTAWTPGAIGGLLVAAGLALVIMRRRETAQG